MTLLALENAETLFEFILSTETTASWELTLMAAV